jgi:hypothetical protein
LDWLDHPRFRPVRDLAVTTLRQHEYSFRKINKVVFLCGANQSTRRDNLAAYLLRNHDDVLIFYAESVWAVIAAGASAANALDVEAKLAELADIVIVIVESPGTFAELGAFANSEPLRQKLLPLLDTIHRGQESFITTGPVRWVDSDSAFRPSLWLVLDRLLESVDQIEERIARIPTRKAARVADLAASPKHLVFFICDIVAVFGPCPASHIKFAVQQIFGSRDPEIDVEMYLGLGKAMRLLESFEHDGLAMFYRPLSQGRLPAFQRRRRDLDIPSLRAQVISVMQTCDACEPVLRELARR